MCVSYSCLKIIFVCPQGVSPLEENPIPSGMNIGSARYFLVLTSSGGHCSGRCASYWNEFLFFKKLCRTSILFVGPLLTLNWTYGDVCTEVQRLSFEYKRYEPEHVSKVYPLAQCLNHNFKRYCLIICQVELTCPLRDTCLLWMSLHPVPWTWLNF